MFISILIFNYTYVKAETFSVEYNALSELLKVEFTAPAASTNIRFETVGFTFTTTKLSNTGRAKGLSGPGKVSINANLRFDNSIMKEEFERNGEVTTTITFTKDQVLQAFSNLDDGLDGMTIYTHAIFRTYKIVDGHKVYRSGYLYNWTDIVNAEEWGSNSLNNFSNYYNMVFSFPIPNSNTLYYQTENGTDLKNKKTLDEKFTGENVNWTGIEEITIDKKGNVKEYKLIGFNAKKKKDGSIKDSKFINKFGDNLTGILKGETKVYSGGMDIILLYKEVIKPLPTPTITPTPIVTPTPGLEPRPIVIPEEEVITIPITKSYSTGVIGADNRQSEKFVVNQGVPTTESLYTQVNTTKYLIGYSLKKQVGFESYPVKVSKEYMLKWKGEDKNGVKELSEIIKVEQVVTIHRAYGYWEILNFDYYRIGSATITNYALPNGSVTLYPNLNALGTLPNVSLNHSSSKQEHIILPLEIVNGVVLPRQTIKGNKNKPVIPKEDFQNIIDHMIPDVTVKNDSLSINGVSIIDSTPNLLEGPDINEDYLNNMRRSGEELCNNNVLYQSDLVIDATKKNGTNLSSGTINYVQVASVNSRSNSIISNNIVNLGEVVIHTPVYCQAVVSGDNDKYVQLIKPSNGLQIVLDEDSSLNDFSLSISNTGFHSYKQGYYTRDFSRSLKNNNVSYIATSNGLLRNEVLFPFDVFINKAEGDEYIKKNTWVILDRNTYTFNVPMWVNEGIYTVTCRTVAVNGNILKLDQQSEYQANTNGLNYVATDTFQVEISGRIYGLSIYDLTDYPLWQAVFREKGSSNLKINFPNKYPDGTNMPSYSNSYRYNYTVGTRNQYGFDTSRSSKFTFPLVNGSHPYYENLGILKTGYVIRFNLRTIGSMHSSYNKIKMKPSFYYVDLKGNNRRAVDLYYNEEIAGKKYKLVKIGSALDNTNLKYMELGNINTGISVEELKDTASILNSSYASLKGKRDSIFTFNDIRIPSTFRTFINKAYTNQMIKNKNYSRIVAAGITPNMIMKQMQSWYGCYYLPAELFAVPLGTDVKSYANRNGITYKESFWLTKGYIIVNFDIVTIDNEGNERLSYINSHNFINKNNMSMWVTEGALLNKTDYKNTTFHFKAGDFIMYYTDMSVKDDYKPAGIY